MWGNDHTLLLVLMGNSATGMNWTCLVYGGPMIFILIWWLVSARKWFKGPKYVMPSTACLNFPINTCRINIEHHMMGRGEGGIDGVPQDGQESSSGSSTKDDKNGLEMDKAGKLA